MVNESGITVGMKLPNSFSSITLWQIPPEIEKIPCNNSEPLGGFFYEGGFAKADFRA
jgi:hypothetical protein